MPVNISINTNTVEIQENINYISVNDPNNPNIVDITQPVTNVVEVITAGPQGPMGPPGTGSIANTGSLLTTASFNSYTGSSTSQFAGTASYALTASFALNAGTTVNTGSFVTTSSFNSFTSSYNTGSFTGSFSGSLLGTSSWAISSSGAISASYALNATTASNILGGKATHIPYFITDTTLATSSIYQSGSSTIIINQDNATAANPEALYVYQPHPTSINVISGKGNLNNYLQLNIHNTNQGTAASSDVVATADNGDETVNYIDMGINSENFSGDIGGANDAYLYSTGKHLHIGNVSNYPVQFFAGGLNTDANRKLELRPDNNHNITGSLQISGGLKVNQGITGSLFGTASYATNALTASYILQAVSSSYSNNSTSASYAVSSSFSTTSSFAISSLNAVTASYILPLNQNVLISGSLKLDPTQDPDPTGTDLDSTVLFQSSSNSALGYDLYFRQNGNLVKWKWIEGILETGLLYGGVVTYSGSNVYISPGSGIIAEHNATTSSEVSPMIEYVTWNAITQSVTNIATQQVTYLYIDNNGALQQQSTRFTSQQYHDYIPLGAVGHFDYTQVSAFGGAVQTAYDQGSQTSNFIDAFGPLKVSGYGLTGQANSLRLSVGSGTSFIHGGFYQNDPEFPSQITTPLQATASMARVNRSGSVIEFDTNGGNFYTVVDPTKYDRDGDGTLANVGSGNWSIQRVFSDPKTGVLYVYYGQARYTSLLNALQFLPTDPFTEGDTFDFTTFVGFLVLKGNASDITDTANNSVLNAGLFRGSGQGSGGGIALSNLEDLTDVSITSPTNGQALIYNEGIWQNGNPISASYALTASYALNGGSGGASFPFTGSAVITGSLTVTGSLRVSQGITGSLFGTASYAVSGGNQSLQQVTSNGASTTNTITVSSLTGQESFIADIDDNANGFTVYTSQTSYGIPFSISNTDISETPFSVNTDGTVNGFQFKKTGGSPTEYLMADGSVTSGSAAAAFPYTGTAVITGSLVITSTLQLDGSLIDYASVSSSIVGSNNLYTQATGSYTSAFTKYTVSNGANARAGEFITVWNGTTVEFTDVSTKDIGSTAGVVFSSAIVSSQIQINTTTATSGWKIKSTTTFI